MTDLAPLMSSANPNWRTPAEVLDPVREFGGGRIFLDPCTTDENPVEAEEFYTKWDDGLTTSWIGGGLIYVNPPYGRALGPWAEKIALEGRLGKEIVALVPARTDTQWWHRNIAEAAAICFWEGRIKFVGAEGPAPFPSALAYWGTRPRAFQSVFGDHGWVVRL